MENVGRLSIVVLCLCCITRCFTLEITRLSIPSFVQNGSEESVILDCEYSYSKEDKNMIVKWYHENNPSPVCTWITEFKFKSCSDEYRVIKDFELPPKDPYTNTGAIKIQNPTTELSGTYRCQVDSVDHSDVEEDSMIVYALPSYVNLNYTIYEENVRVVCEIEDVYPLPEVSFFQIEPGELEETPIDDLKRVSKLEDGAYDLEVYADIPERNLTTKAGNLRFFGCIVALNGAEYEKVVKVPYFPNPVAEKQEGDDSDDDANDGYFLTASSFILLLVLAITLLLT